jgi:MFS family permease
MSERDRSNGLVFTLSYACIYFAAPVLYIGVVQAALANKLGAGAATANLPASAYQFGQIAPLIFSWLIPHRLERNVVTWANLLIAALLACVFIILLLPVHANVILGALALQGLVQGFGNSVSHVFMIQCLTRGTTQEGRARALRQTFALTPLCAVAGSLTAQYILGSGILASPHDFALLYAIGAPCSLTVALLSSRYLLDPIPEETRQPFFRFVASSIRAYFSDPNLVRMWFTYVMFYTTLGLTSNLALYMKEAVGRDPKDFSGLLMAIRFGFKALAGVGLGWIAIRAGFRAAALTCMGLLGAACLWARLVPGFANFFSSGLLGGGELGGMYIPNVVASLSAAAAGPRNLSILTLATPASSFAPALHGLIADRLGFAWSFYFGIATAIAGALLIYGVRRKGHRI